MVDKENGSKSPCVRKGYHEYIEYVDLNDLIKKPRLICKHCQKEKDPE